MLALNKLAHCSNDSLLKSALPSVSGSLCSGAERSLKNGEVGPFCPALFSRVSSQDHDSERMWISAYLFTRTCSLPSFVAMTSFAARMLVLSVTSITSLLARVSAATSAAR